MVTCLRFCFHVTAHHWIMEVPSPETIPLCLGAHMDVSDALAEVIDRQQ